MEFIILDELRSRPPASPPHIAAAIIAIDDDGCR
jgi:hypothetical protein